MRSGFLGVGPLAEATLSVIGPLQNNSGLSSASYGLPSYFGGGLRVRVLWTQDFREELRFNM